MTRSKWDEVQETLTSGNSGGSFTVSYPTGREAADYQGGTEHILLGQSFRQLKAEYNEFSLTFGASNITVTMNTNVTGPAGETVTLMLDRAEADARVVDGGTDLASATKMNAMEVVEIDLGAPITADVDGVCTTELLGAAGAIPIDGARATDGVATLDVPRNITLTVATTDHSGLTITVTGTDEYGATVVEDITGPNNNTVSGKKAFKTVTAVESDGAIATNGISVGFGDVLGLPVFMAEAGDKVYEKEDGATATAGTFVAGVQTTPSATTGDVRGTYDPNSAADGSKVFKVGIAVRNTAYKGATQYSG
ncbi:hypothetical protein [Mameliella alba]|uniref:Uncharacterized protein n=1 Tax=Mameliella alba TaxID=561184 RepID=A0A0B3RWG9_9RHOB|nr:hypothetical protein [Mameliella alba]KHQ51088.1 hypothetical protein OA50_04459 [Mameliella alba]